MTRWPGVELRIDMGHHAAGGDVADQAELAAAVDDQGADAQDLEWRSSAARSGGAGTCVEKEKPVSTTRSSAYIRLPRRELELLACSRILPAEGFKKSLPATTALSAAECRVVHRLDLAMLAGAAAAFTACLPVCG